jgi:tetratricopeptide (TPR) repeat protein
MNVFEEHKNRQIIPRWLPLGETCKLIPPDAIDTSWMLSPLSLDALAAKREAWRDNRHLVYAIDLVCSANLIGEISDTEIFEAASFILEGSEVAPTVRDVALRILKRDIEPYSIAALSLSEIRQRIHLLRKKAPGSRDPFLFLDLAFNYSLSAQNVKAARCVEVALALGDNNPIVLRAAARFYLHAHRSPDRALHLLRAAALTPHHPLLVASEISISEAFGIKSPFRKIGRQLLSADVHPWLLTELAGTIGTLEVNSQSIRRAKDAFRLASKCPNENSLAQMRWISNRCSIPLSMEASCKPDATFEADAIAHYRAEEFQGALDAAVKWMRFQPFSARPAILASFVASVALEEYDTAATLINEALVASPDSFILRNNLAFALASMGRVEDALQALMQVDRARVSPTDAAVADATLGLISFRRGEIERGRELYKAAISAFERLGDRRRAVVAEVFWAREECLASTAQSNEAVARVLPKSKDFKGFKVLERLKRHLGI